MIYVKSGLRFSSEVTLNPTLVSEFAKAAGDYNPMHHDPQFAAKTRFKRLIASAILAVALTFTQASIEPLYAAPTALIAE